MHITFDTLEMVRRLEAKGFKREQAEEVISVVKDVQSELATKQDIELVRKDMIALKNDIIIKISGVMFALLITFKLFDKFF